MSIIGTSHHEVQAYQEDTKAVFVEIHGDIYEFVNQIYAITYEGPDAEQFNLDLKRVIESAVSQIGQSMADFMHAIGQITSNISRSLGGVEFDSTYTPPVFESPSLPGVIADDYKIDISQMNTVHTVALPEMRRSVYARMQQNVERFAQIPQASVEQRGWSGESREYAQHTVIPAQVENFESTVGHVEEEISSFLQNAKSNAVSADTV